MGYLYGISVPITFSTFIREFMRFKRQLGYLIIISLCTRLLIAYTTELGNDEVYYYTYALHLQWNYFDHPPGVALLILLSTFNLWLTNELFVRLGAILCAAAGTWLCYKTGTLIRNERTGIYAAVLYNTSIYASIIAGTFILPDSPQIICWLGALFILIKIVLQADTNKRISPRYWLLFALLSGLCIQCKVHGVFLWFGLGLYILFYNRKLLLQPWLYISCLLTLVIISPIIIWNLNNHFITWAYHSNRVAVHSFSLNINSFLQAFFGQLFYNNPINVCLIAAAIYHMRTKHLMRKSISRLLLLTGLPIIIVVSVISLFNSVLPHWSGPSFVTLSFMAAAYLDKKVEVTQQALPVWLKSSVWLILIAVAGGMAIIQLYPGTMGSKDIRKYGSGDFTLDLCGWRSFEKQYSIWLQQQGAEYSHLKIVCNKWFPAAHIEYYIARPIQAQVVGVGYLDDVHNFAWLNKARTDLKDGEDAICIVPSNYNTDMQTSYATLFSTVTKLHTFTAQRSGKVVRYFTVYLLQHYHAIDEAHIVTVK